MASDIKTALSDSEFHTLPINEQRQFASEFDPEINSLNDDDFKSFVNEFKPSPDVASAPEIGSGITGIEPSAPLWQRQAKQLATETVKQAPYLAMGAAQFIPQVQTASMPMRLLASGLAYAGTEKATTGALALAGDTESQRKIQEYSQKQPLEQNLSTFKDIAEGATLEMSGPIIGKVIQRTAAGFSPLTESFKNHYRAAEEMGVHLRPESPIFDTLSNSTAFSKRILNRADMKNIVALEQRRSELLAKEGGPVQQEEIEKIGLELKSKIDALFKDQEAIKNAYIEKAQLARQAANGEINSDRKSILEEAARTNEILAQSHNDLIAQRKQTLLQKIGSDEDYLSLGKSAKESYAIKQQKMKDSVNKIWKDFESQLPEDHIIKIPDAQRTAQSFYDKYATSELKDQPVMRQLKAIADGQEAILNPRNLIKQLDSMPQSDHVIRLRSMLQDGMNAEQLRGVIDNLPKGETLSALEGVVQGLPMADVKEITQAFYKDYMNRGYKFKDVQAVKGILNEGAGFTKAYQQGGQFERGRGEAQLGNVAGLIDKGISESISPEIAKSYRAAKELSRSAYKLAETRSAGKLTADLESEVMPTFFPKSSPSKGSSLSEAMEAKKLVDEETYGRLQKRFMTDLLEGDLSKLNKVLDSYGNDMLSHTIGKKNLLELRKLGDIAGSSPEQVKITESIMPQYLKGKIEVPKNLLNPDLDIPLVKKIARESPEKIMGAIIQPGNSENIKLIRRLGGDKSIERLRQGWLSKNLESNVTQEQFADMVDAYSVPLKELYGIPTFNKMKQIADLVRQLPTKESVSGAVQLQSGEKALLGLAGGGMYFSPKAAATGFGVVYIPPAISAKLLTNPKYNKFLVEGFKPNSSINLGLYNKLQSAVQEEMIAAEGKALPSGYFTGNFQ